MNINTFTYKYFKDILTIPLGKIYNLTNPEIVFFICKANFRQIYFTLWLLSILQNQITWKSDSSR